MIDTKLSISTQLKERFADFLSERMGIYFPKDRLAEMEKKLLPAIAEFKFQDPEACLDWLMSGPLSEDQIAILAPHFTIGETYFFRDSATFKTLEEVILPEIIRKKDKTDKTIRLWSVATCTGEEAYSLAILIDRLLPNLDGWTISIIGTDINSKFLQKAIAGDFKEWSFRGIAPEIKEKYFIKKKDGKYALIPKIKKMVKFFYLNLVESNYPDISLGLYSVDLALCNNVLIYFSEEKIKKVIGQITDTIKEDGWLSASPIEVPYIHHAFMHLLKVQDITFFKKSRKYKEDTDLSHIRITHRPKEKITTFVPPEETIKVEFPAFLDLPNPTLEFDFSSTSLKNLPVEAQAPSHKDTVKKESDDYAKLYDKGLYDTIVKRVHTAVYPLVKSPHKLQEHIKEIKWLIKSYASLGQLKSAKEWCLHAIASEKLDPELYYLLSGVYEEEKNYHEALNMLKKSIFIDTNFIAAHFALGNLSKKLQKNKEAERHYRNALQLLQKHSKEHNIPSLEEMSADRLTEIISSIYKGLKT